MDVPKTQVMAGILKSLGVNETLLIAIEQHDTNTYKSARNIEGVRILPVAEINAYEVLRPKRLLITKAALDAFVGNPQ
jgi:large subunit ribosomal protein L4